MSKISPMLWFDNQAEEAANFYVSLFPNSRIVSAGGMTVAFELDGVPFTGLNGGLMFKFNEAVSFVIDCEDQAEVDRYWDALLADGGSPSQCGWLKDRFGLSWQVVPKALGRLMSDPDKAKAGRVAAAMMKMIKLDVAALEAAAA
jgi:predicted 3-demethylubiquinone-9 3-methyltransferase (glyoxalase superfamily)